MTTDTTPRWVYRFSHFRKAYALLEDDLQLMHARPLSVLEKAGLIQHFEVAWELAWKVLKDKLEHEGVALDTTTPATVIRTAFSSKLITDGEAWMAALKERNTMSHEYDPQAAEHAVERIKAAYFPLFQALHARCKKELEGGQ